MIYILVFLSALTIMEVKTLNIEGHVGNNVTIKCSDWNVWTNVNFNMKYLCKSPCSEDKHIIIKADFGQTKNKNRIEITNREEGLFVTFTDLKLSDSRKYYCGVERYGYDSFIEVNLNITDDSSDVIIESYTTFYATAPTASATQGSGNTPYWIIGLIFIIMIIFVLLICTRRMKKKNLMSTPPKDIGGSVEPDGLYQSLHPSFEDKNQVYSTLTPTKRSAASDEVYETLDPSTIDPDQV